MPKSGGVEGLRAWSRMEEAKERSPNTAADWEGEEAGRGKHRKWTGRPGR